MLSVADITTMHTAAPQAEQGIIRSPVVSVIALLAPQLLVAAIILLAVAAAIMPVVIPVAIPDITSSEVAEVMLLQAVLVALVRQRDIISSAAVVRTTHLPARPTGLV